MFENLPKEHFGAILADPPWRFLSWSDRGKDRAAENHYKVMALSVLETLPIERLAKTDCVLFLWATWPLLQDALSLITWWGFQYKTCAFCWTKADNTQPHFFTAELNAEMKLGYWTRANSEVCLLATRGKPKRRNADVRQAIIAPSRQHSRKPDGIHKRIERLVTGPYLERFARQKRHGWTTWGDQTDKFPEVAREAG